MKYKLIKEYPGSPELGFITDKTLHFPQDYPEFWQPVVEKDYEILSYITIESEIIKYKDLDINDDCNCDKYLKIYSVKRLSDGEIFTVGDKLQYNMTIESFKFENFGNGEKLTAQDKNGGRFLDELKKLKQPLFTTEDGVDIFEGDKTYYVFNDLTPECNSGFKCKWKVRGGFYQNYQVNQGNEYYKVFSTKEKAEEYILMNKPCLSINDVLNINTNGMNKTISFKKEITDLVKSKI